MSEYFSALYVMGKMISFSEIDGLRHLISIMIDGWAQAGAGACVQINHA